MKNFFLKSLAVLTLSVALLGAGGSAFAGGWGYRGYHHYNRCGGGCGYIECYGDYHIGTVIVTITVLEDVVAEDAHVLMWTSTGIST